MTRAPMVDLAVQWIERNYWNAIHLTRSLEWLEQIAPDADESVQIATVLHDIERAFPAPDAPVFDATKGPDEPDYNRRHCERSAHFAARVLRELSAEAELIETVQALIRVHEDGGWPEADLVQAADSLSFLETNVDLLLSWLPTRKHGLGQKEAIEKLRYMRDRIRIPVVRELAVPLCKAAERRIYTEVSKYGASAESGHAV